MALWEETQRQAQSLDVLIASRHIQIQPDDLSYEIAADAYEPTAADWKEYGLYLEEQERQNPDPRLSDPNLQPEMDIEP